MITPETKFGFNDRSYGRLKFAISSSAASFDLLFVTPFLPGWAANKDLYATFRAPDGTIEIIKIIDIFDHTLTVARGQEGTVAVAWPPGSLLVQRPTAGSLGTILQKGEYRTVNYNPNGILSANYPGEKVYETGANACQVRWWLNNGGTKWRLLAGEKCVNEYYDDDGYIYLSYVDYACDIADRVVRNYNADFATCRNASIGNFVGDYAYYDNGMSTFWAAWASEYRMYRSFLFCDLFYAWAGITGVELHCKGAQNGPDPFWTVSVQEGTQAVPMTTADYDAFTGGLFGTFLIDDFPKVVNMTMNNDGLTYIQGVAVAGGFAKLCLREYDHDYQNVSPGAELGGMFGFYYADAGLGSDRPFLRLRYD